MRAFLLILALLLPNIACAQMPEFAGIYIKKFSGELVPLRPANARLSTFRQSLPKSKPGVTVLRSPRVYDAQVFLDTADILSAPVVSRFEIESFIVNSKREEITQVNCIVNSGQYLQNFEPKHIHDQYGGLWGVRPVMSTWGWSDRNFRVKHHDQFNTSYTPNGIELNSFICSEVFGSNGGSPKIANIGFYIKTNLGKNYLFFTEESLVPLLEEKMIFDWQIYSYFKGLPNLDH